jgi:uncharacterized protein (DUF1697 family)
MALVVFLKGVNVGGHRRFRPSVLARELRKYAVVNVGAAGTFVVMKPIGRAKLRCELLRRLPFVTEIIICSAREIISLADAAPFAGRLFGADIVRFVSVLARRPRWPPDIPFSLPAGGDWLVKLIELRGRFALGLYRRQMRTIGALGQLEKRLGGAATTRNWNTIMQIVGILSRRGIMK